MQGSDNQNVPPDQDEIFVSPDISVRKAVYVVFCCECANGVLGISLRCTLRLAVGFYTDICRAYARLLRTLKPLIGQYVQRFDPLFLLRR